jgi:hypothetical protein
MLDSASAVDRRHRVTTSDTKELTVVRGAASLGASAEALPMISDILVCNCDTNAAVELVAPFDTAGPDAGAEMDAAPSVGAGTEGSERAADDCAALPVVSGQVTPKTRDSCADTGQQQVEPHRFNAER